MDLLRQVRGADLAVTAAITLLLAITTRVIYNLFFHPLAGFPGPLLHRATRFAFVYKCLRGTLPRDVLPLHEQYGPIVRVAPDELSFAHEEAWKDIYGHRTGAQLHGQDELSKYWAMYRIRGSPRSIMTEDREQHAFVRRQLAHGFSDRSMRQQEPVIDGYVDLLVRRLRERCASAVVDGETGGVAQTETPAAAKKANAVNLTEWYNWTTFDIIGDLAFGESFGGLEHLQYHPSVAAITDMVRATSILVSFKYLGLEDVVQPLLKVAMKRSQKHRQQTRKKLERRMALHVERPDLIESLLKKHKSQELDFDRLQANASTLIVGGSETTATLLSGVTYLLLKNPQSLKKLTAEVRSSFQSEDDITLSSVSKLSYMLACLNEALRCYPPIPWGMPRYVDKGGATIAGRFIPEKTIVAIWQLAINHNSRLWTMPFSYRPERFLGDPEFSDDKLDALQPFAVGPRNCLGRNLAYAEMRLILARIIFSFDMQLVDDEDDWMDQEIYLLWKKRPLNVYLTPVR